MLPRLVISTAKLINSYNRKILKKEKKASHLMKERANPYQGKLRIGKPLMELKKVRKETTSPLTLRQRVIINSSKGSIRPIRQR